MKAILKASNKILTTNGKIFQVGEARGPILDLHAGSVVASEGAPFAVWPDQSGNGINAVQTTAAAQFTLHTVDGRKAVLFPGTAATGNASMSLMLRVPTKQLFFIIKPIAGSGTEHSLNASIGYDSLTGIVQSRFWGSSTVYFKNERNTVATNAFTKAYLNRGLGVAPSNVSRVNGIWVGIFVDTADLESFLNVLNYHFAAYVHRLVAWNYRLTELNRIATIDQYLTEAGL